MPTNIGRPCPACGANDHAVLPVPHARQTMVSDGTILPRPLRKLSCNSCGYGYHAVPQTLDDAAEFYSQDYDLGLRNGAADMARATAYATEVIKHLGWSKIQSLVEFGCGTGNLLSLLKSHLKATRAVGIEASTRLAKAAAETHDGLEIEETFAENFKVEEDGKFDLCLSVNVVEHALDPTSFLTACAQAVRPGGTVLVICPDGEVPGSELLFCDHISSFSVRSLSDFAVRAELSLTHSEALEGGLSGFRLHHLVHENSEARVVMPASALSKGRSDFLEHWKKCAANIEEAVGSESYAIFGVGEFTDLLATYAPSIIERATSFVIDNPQSDICHGKPVLPTEAFLAQGSTRVLLAAINERNWQGLKNRFAPYDIDLIHPTDLISGRAKTGKRS